MRKVLAILTVCAMIMTLSAACAQDESGVPEENPNDHETANSGQVLTSYGVISWEAGETPIALITDYGDIDDESYNQGAWEGVLEFAVSREIPHDFFRPIERGSTEANLDSISKAVNAGAQIIVTPGFLFTESVFEAQKLWPDLIILLLDSIPAPPDGDQFIAPNTASVLFAEEQPSFLAGYAAVMDGYRNLGYIGGIPGPSLVRFGSGFVQGAEYAASQLGLEPGAVTVRYNYLFSFSASPEAQAMAAGWYADGVEIIFAAAGGATLSIIAASDAAGARVIGVDVDQGYHSETVVTSALKELRPAVSQILDSIFKGTFEGGRTLRMDVTNNGVGLPRNFDRFNNFTESDYDEIFNRLATGEVVVSEDFSDMNPANMIDFKFVDVIFIS